jgi:hypothetical protein
MIITIILLLLYLSYTQAAGIYISIYPRVHRRSQKRKLPPCRELLHRPTHNFPIRFCKILASAAQTEMRLRRISAARTQTPINNQFKACQGWRTVRRYTEKGGHTRLLGTQRFQATATRRDSFRVSSPDGKIITLTNNGFTPRCSSCRARHGGSLRVLERRCTHG